MMRMALHPATLDGAMGWCVQTADAESSMEKFLMAAMVAKAPSPDLQLPLFEDSIRDTSMHGSVGGSVHTPGRKPYWQVAQQSMTIPDTTFNSGEGMALPRKLSVTSVLHAFGATQFNNVLGSQMDSIRNVRLPPRSVACCRECFCLLNSTASGRAV